MPAAELTVPDDVTAHLQSTVSTYALVPLAPTVNVLVLGLESGEIAVAVPTSTASLSSSMTLAPTRFRAARGPVRSITPSPTVALDGTVVSTSTAVYAVAFDVWDAVAVCTGTSSNANTGGGGNWRDKLIAKKKQQRVAKRMSVEDAAALAAVTTSALRAQPRIPDSALRLVECHGHYLPVTSATVGHCDGTVALWTGSLDGSIRAFRRNGAPLRVINVGFPVVCFAFPRMDAAGTSVYFYDRLAAAGVDRVAYVDRHAGSRPGRDPATVEKVDEGTGTEVATVVKLTMPTTALSGEKWIDAIEWDASTAVVRVSIRATGDGVEWLVTGNPALAVPTITTADVRVAAASPAVALNLPATPLHWPPSDVTLARATAESLAADDAADELDEELEGLRAEHAKLQALCDALMQRVKAARTEA